MISISDAIKLAEIGVGVLSALRDKGVAELTAEDIAALRVDPDKLKKIQEAKAGQTRS